MRFSCSSHRAGHYRAQFADPEQDTHSVDVGSAGTNKLLGGVELQCPQCLCQKNLLQGGTPVFQDG